MHIKKNVICYITIEQATIFYVKYFGCLCIAERNYKAGNLDIFYNNLGV